MYPNCNCCTTYNAPADLMDGGVTAARTEQEAEPWRPHHVLRAERDEALAMAALWKETARRALFSVRHMRSGRDVMRDAYERASKGRAEAIARADEAETALADVQERYETVARLEARLIEAEEGRDNVEAERDDALHSVKVLRADLERAEGHDCIRDAAVIETMRPMRAEDVTDEMRARAREVAAGQMPYSWWGGAEWWGYADEILTAALTVSQRPDGAEGIEAALLDADEAGFFNLAPRAIEDLADWLAERGVRMTTEKEN